MSETTQKQTGEQPASPGYTPDMVDILERAQQGDEAVLLQLQALLAGRPELVKQFGDLARHAEDCFLKLAAGTSCLAKESTRLHLAKVKEELSQPSASPLEKLLIDRIAVSWLQVHHADLDAATVLNSGQSTTPRSVQAHRRLDQAHRRYLASIKQLAIVRKLLKPSPSILDIAMRPIPETNVKGAKQRDRNTPVNEGVPVFN
jgi:hypothetical protein